MAANRTSRSWLDRATAWSPVFLLGGLAALTYWLDAQVQTPPPRRDGSARHDADLYIEGVRAAKLDPEGRPLQSLVATRADHFADDLTTDFKDITLGMTQFGKPPFRVTAKQATLTGDRENVYFRHDVHATREASPATADEEASGPVTLTTEYLHVMPEQQTANTDQAVTIEEPRGIIHAVGLEMDNHASTVKLNSSVNGTLQPKVVPK
jgi:lipopolysaccharide export system protein LptC